MTHERVEYTSATLLPWDIRYLMKRQKGELSCLAPNQEMKFCAHIADRTRLFVLGRLSKRTEPGRRNKRGLAALSPISLPPESSRYLAARSWRKFRGAYPRPRYIAQNVFPFYTFVKHNARAFTGVKRHFCHWKFGKEIITRDVTDEQENGFQSHESEEFWLQEPELWFQCNWYTLTFSILRTTTMLEAAHGYE